MKIIISFLTVIVLSSFSLKETRFEIVGNIEGYEDSTVVYLRDFNNRVLIPNPSLDTGFVDSAYIISGEFFFSGKLKFPKRFAIHTEIESKSFPDTPVSVFWLENSVITYKSKRDDLDNVIIQGSVLQKQEDEFNLTIAASIDSSKMLMRAIKQKDSLKIAEYSKRDIYKSGYYLRSKKQEFIKANPSYLYSVLLLSEIMFWISIEETDELYSLFSKDLKSSYYGKEIVAHLKR